MKRIVIKIGSQCLIDRCGYIRQNVVESVVDQVVCLKRKGHAVLIVTSGAVAIGHTLLRKAPDFLNSRLENKVAFSLGMPRLFDAYQTCAHKKDLLCAQILLTKDDFRTRERYLQIMHLFEGLIFEENIIPIVNENDTITSQESSFTDNDELAGLLSAQVRAHRLIIFTTVKGLYDKNPEKHLDAQLITEISPNDIIPSIDTHKSQIGRGGMLSKLTVALKVSKLGTETIITHIDSCQAVCSMDDHHIGTKIHSSRNVSSFKRWLSFCQGVAGVYANEGAITALKEKGASLLPIGITDIHDHFEKNDVIYIFDNNHRVVAVGQAAYSSKDLQKKIGLSRQPELIHCDNLYVY